MQSLFPITEYWSWVTFVLYIAVSIVVCRCCRAGAIWRQKTDDIFFKEKHRVRLVNSNIYFGIAFFILVLLGTLRTVDVGSDTQVYIGYFDNIGKFSFKLSNLFNFNQMEPGFQIYLRLIRNISSNYTFLFFVNSILISTAYIAYIKYFFDEKSDYTFLQIFIFYYVSNMSGMRAALATVFILFSYIMLAKGKNIKAIILTLFACSFHYTMVFNFYIIIMIMLFKSEELRKRKWLWTVSLLATLGIAMTSTYALRGIFAGTKYSFYTDKLEELSLLGSMFFVLFGIFAFGFYREIMLNDKYSEKIKNIYLVTIAFLVTYPVIFVTGAYRIPNYYVLPRLTIWGEMKIFYGKYVKQRQIYQLIIQIIIILYLLFRFTRSSVDGGFIYHWIL